MRGRDGICAVLEVTRLQRGDAAALHMYVPDAATSLSAQASFLHQARTALGLGGAHAARIVDAGILPDGVPYAVSEAPPGVDLATELARRGAFPPGEAVQYVLAVCAALVEAHARGIAHGDLGLGRVLLTALPDGAPWVVLAGLGIAREASKGADRPDRADLADVRALGAMLYEGLTGRRPVPPLPIDGRIPRDLRDIVLACILPGREPGFASVAALAAALSRFAQAMPAAPAAREVHAAAPVGPAPATAHVPPPLAVAGSPSTAGSHPPARPRYATIAAVALAVSIAGISAAALLHPARSRDPGETTNLVASSVVDVPAASSPATPSPARPSPARPSPARPSPATPSPAAPSSPATPAPAAPSSPATPAPAAPSSPAVASSPAAGQPVDESQRVRCSELLAQKQWREAEECASQLAGRGAVASVDALRATARQERENERHSGELQDALRAGNLQAAQDALGRIAASSSYRAAARAAFQAAESQRSDEATRKAQALASAHDCEALRGFVRELSVTGTDRVVAAARAAVCDDAPASLARASEPPAPPQPPTAAPAAAALDGDCKAMNIDDVMTRAAIQFDAGAASTALSLTRAALGCKQTDRMYWLAVMYACAAHDPASARLYFPRVPANLQSGIERRCQQANLDVRSR